MRIIVVGGVAGGMSAAARARRLDESAEIIVLEKGPYVSFANCGLPYHVGGEIPSDEALLLHTPQTLREDLNLDVRVGHEATAIDTEAHTVTVTTANGVETLTYDALVLSPGADAFAPPIPGIDSPHVTFLRTVDEARALAEAAGSAKAAVVMGAGFIGLETAEALHRRGLEVTIVEMAPRVLPPLAPEMSALVESELEANRVAVRTGTSIAAIGPAFVTLSDGADVPADIVVVSAGVRPRTGIARDAGIELDARGAILVDNQQRTSAPGVWAVGDATAVTHGVTGVVSPVPLAGPANRQGRRAADSICGTAKHSRSVLGTAIIRVFGLTAAVTGATPQQLDDAGISYVPIHVHPNDHAGYYPGATPVNLVGYFAPDGKLLGAQGVGAAGVDKRIDVLATALRAHMGADDLAELELAYAPPYSSAKDPVNILGFLMQNVLDGTLRLWHASELAWAADNALLLDVRAPGEFALGHLEGAVNIPHVDIRERIDEVRRLAVGRPVYLYCQSGFRSYLAHRILSHHGIESANLSGGMLTMLTASPTLSYALA